MTSVGRTQITPEAAATKIQSAYRGYRTRKDLTEFEVPNLHSAARSGCSLFAKRLIRANADLEAKEDQYGWTPLFTALESDQGCMVKVLLDAGANPEAEGGYDTPLVIASRSNSLDMVRILLKANANPEVEDCDGTPLVRASESNSLGMVKVLLEGNADIGALDYGGRPCLLLAAEEGHTKIVRELLAQNADPEATGESGSYSPLAAATEKGHIDISRLLLEGGAKTEVSTEDGDYPILNISARSGALKISEALVGFGANVNGVDPQQEYTPLHCAAEKGHRTTVNFLLERNANPDVQNVRGETPLHLAAEGGNIGVAASLLMHSARIDAKDRAGHTALSEATGKGHLEVVNLLLRSGAETEVSKHWFTPLQHAAHTGRTRIVERLLQGSADVNAQNRFGNLTPLHFAVMNRHAETARVITQFNPDTQITDTAGRTPFDWAVLRDLTEVSKLLLPLEIESRKKTKQMLQTARAVAVVTTAVSLGLCCYIAYSGSFDNYFSGSASDNCFAD